jgi:Protein of unknown function (DUF2950)
MRQTTGNGDKFSWTHLSWLAATIVFLMACLPAPLAAQEKGQKTFASAEEAAAAFATAAQNNNEQVMLEILGPKGKSLISSGDATEDAENRADFAKRYQQMHRLVREPDGTTTLYIGAENWPCPIPIVNKGNVWYYDTAAGEREILYRRIGRNEVSAMHICRAVVVAQKEYYSMENGEYAQQTFSDEGKHNGLYWKVAAGEPESPIGPLVAQANAEGYNKGAAGPPTPYRGYLFHVLTSQGKDAPGGAKSYIVNGRMTEGFGFVAYPAEYRSSGVMTFIIGSDGVLYEKDLGKKTETIGKAMKEYDPDPSWQKLDPLEDETASNQPAK